MDLTELRIFIILFLMLTIPGWAFLTITGLWRKWEPFQRWSLAIAISIASYPILFYFLRLLFPSLRFGANKLALLLVLAGVITAAIQRKNFLHHLKFGRIEVWATLVIAITVITRIAFIKIYPYPAWSDSLHHTLITKLVATNGRLPYTLEPFASTPLDMYHLGLYALSGSLAYLARIPAHTALLWTAQFLNGLCGLGIYFVLSRSKHPIGGIIGLIFAGLFSFQPAWYANWGRFTQLASQAIILFAWWMTVETIKTSGNSPIKTVISSIVASSILIAGVFLLHFRVAGFLLPLLGITLLWSLVEKRKSKQTIRFLLVILCIGILSLVLISPALFNAFGTYSSRQASISESSDFTYYQFPFNSLFVLGLQPWIIVLALIATAIVVYFRNNVGITTILWTGCLILIGFAYLVDIPILRFTNMGAVLILLYLPASILIGLASSILAQRLKIEIALPIQRVLMTLLILMIAVASINRVTAIEPFRHFLTDGDVEAMRWVSENTPSDAIFAINTYLWLGNSPHGTDGGYWIPYFTGRQTTASTMIYNLDTLENVDRVINMSRAAKMLAESPPRTDALCELGVNFVYLGPKGDFSGGDINVNELIKQPAVNIIYHKRGVVILQICNP